jgi:hypothetical protein
MKLTKLSAAWLPDWTCRLMPAPVNFGRGHRFAAYPRCSTDVTRGVRMRRGATVVSLVAALTWGCRQQSATPKTMPTPAHLSGAARVALASGSFEVPATCTLDCVMDVVPPQGGMLCWEPSGAGQDRTGHFTVDGTVALDAGAAQGSAAANSGSVHWGVAADGGFCAVVTTRAPSVTHTWQFCTRSQDRGVRELLRGVAQSYRPARSEERSPCML